MSEERLTWKQLPNGIRQIPIVVGILLVIGLVLFGYGMVVGSQHLSENPYSGEAYDRYQELNFISAEGYALMHELDPRGFSQRPDGRSFRQSARRWRK